MILEWRRYAFIKEKPTVYMVNDKERIMTSLFSCEKWRADMRSLKKNMQSLWFSTYSEEIPIYELDENGNIKYIEVDGELKPIELGKVAGYNEPVLFYANISAGKGEAELAVFGTSLDFSRAISTCDMTCPIDELTRIWIDREVKYNSDGTVDGDSADYKVVAKPAKSLNSIVIAIKELPKGNV